MGFQIFGQRDPRWAKHALGSGAGELGLYGCLLTSFCMIAYDAYSDLKMTPDVFDTYLYSKGEFVHGDELPDNALDRTWPDRFSTTVENGWNQAHVNAAVASPDTYAVVCIHNPAIGVSGYHFMVVYSPSTVADPWYDDIATDRFWAMPGDVVKVIYVKSLAAQRAAAQAAAAQAAAQAAAAKAAADAAKAAAAAAAAKAAADAAAAKAAADAAAAAAKAQADYEAALAAAQAAADAREARAHAAADAAARASAAQVQPVGPLDSAEKSFFDALDTFLVLLVERLRGIPTTSKPA